MLNDRDVVLELYKRVATKEGGNSGDWRRSELLLLSDDDGEDNLVVVDESSVVGCGFKEAVVRLGRDNERSRLTLTAAD